MPQISTQTCDNANKANVLFITSTFCHIFFLFHQQTQLVLTLFSPLVSFQNPSEKLIKTAWETSPHKTHINTSISSKGNVASARQPSRTNKHDTEMRRRKRTNIFQLCALCISTITIINLISECSAGSSILLEDRMEVVRRVLREVPLIDG